MTTRDLILLAIIDDPGDLFELEALVAGRLPEVRLLTTPDPLQGLTLAVEEGPDVILLNHDERGLDGLGLCGKLKGDERLRAIPVLVVSVPGSPPSEGFRVLEAGAEGFLTRPFQEAELVAQIRTMAKLKKAGRLRQMEPEEPELAASQRALASLMRDLPGLAYRCRNDPDWTMEFLSGGCRALTGYACADLLDNARMSYAEVIHPEDRQGVRDAVQSALAKGEGYKLVYRIITADDQVKWVWEQGHGTSGPDGKPGALEGFITDVTESRQAEEDLRRNEARLRSLVELHRYRDASMQEFLDHALAEAIQLTESAIGYIFLYQEDQQRFALSSWSKDVMKECSVSDSDMCQGLDQAGSWGEAVRQRKPIIRNDFQAHHPMKQGCPDGHVPLHRFLTLPVFKEGRIVAVVGVANKPRDYDDSDVLQLTLLMDTVWNSVGIMKSEEALRESEEKYRLLAETAHDFIVLYDRKGRVVYVNRAGLDFIGLGPEEPGGCSIRNLVPPERLADLEARWGKPSPGEGESHFFETEMMNRAGDRIPVEVSLTPIREQGEVVRMLMVARDISGRREAEEDRDRLQARLIQAQKMDAVGRLAGGVAHDFNNMLSVILGQAEFVLGALSPEGPFFTELLEIRKAAERSAEITRQLLGFARRQTIAPEILDLNRSVDDALKMLRRVIGEDVDLVWRPESGVWPVKMDPSQVDQILTNLCVNARDAMAGAGKIIIETGTCTLDDAFCSTHPGSKPGEYTLLTVRDTGSGMDRETMDRVFEPFFTTKELGKGTGLGLATTYGIVKQNDGFIEVQSEPGKGSVFRIYLRPYRSMGEGATEEGQKAPAPGKLETVLLVEDEAAVLGLTRRILEHQDFRVLAASTPDEAIRLADDHAGEIHLLLTDVVMPQMNGRELASRLMSRYPDLKIMFMSGYPAEVIAHHGVLEEGTEFIQKPYSAQELGAKVRAALDAN